jgi:hypothetical protein
MSESIAEQKTCNGKKNPADRANSGGASANMDRPGKKARGTAKAPTSAAQSPDAAMTVMELALITPQDPENRKKRLKLAEALRECGFDEPKVAAFLRALAAKLSRNRENGAAGVAAAKLLLEVLKEITRVLEPQKNAANSDASDAPQFVRLIHNVPRPVRTA